MWKCSQSQSHTRTYQLRCQRFKNSIFNACKSVVSKSGAMIRYRPRSLKASPGAQEFSSTVSAGKAEAWCQTGLISFPPVIGVAALLVKNIHSFLFRQLQSTRSSGDQPATNALWPRLQPGVGSTPFSSSHSPNTWKVQQSAIFQQAAENRGFSLLLPADLEEFLGRLTRRCVFTSSPGRKNKTL